MMQQICVFKYYNETSEIGAEGILRVAKTFEIVDQTPTVVSIRLEKNSYVLTRALSNGHFLMEIQPLKYLNVNPKFL